MLIRMKKIFSIMMTLLLCILLTTGNITSGQSGQPCEINIQYTVINTDLSDIDAVEDAINQISIPKIGVKINIVPVFIGNLAADTAYAIASGEKIDIVNVGLTNDITTLVSDGMLLALDDLLKERGQKAAEVTKNVSEAEKIGGITYAVSQYPYAANCTGFYYNMDLAASLGIDMHDGMTMVELEKAGEILKDNDVFLTAVGLSTELSYKFVSSMETFGESGAYGVIPDPAHNTDIVNIYEEEELREFYRTLRKWYENGYLPQNQLLDEPSIMRMFSEGKLFCLPTNVTAKQLGNGRIMSFEAGIIKTSDILITTSGAVEFMLGIASSCKNPEAAMDFINLIYTDSDVANLINYGIEGIDYVKVEGTENVITTIGTENENGTGYGSGFVQFGDPLMLKIKYPLDDNYYNELLKWENNAEKSLAFGYSFDAQEYTLNAINISKILDEYLPILNAGIAEDVDAQMDALISELKDAGIDEIIAANNEQLKEYLKGT